MAQEKKQGQGFANKKPVETDVPLGQSSIPNAGDILAKMDAIQAEQVTVIHGASDGKFNVAGSSISKVRASLVDAFNIPADALSFVDGEQVDNDYVLQANQTLEFVKQAGVKGSEAKFFCNF